MNKTMEKRIRKLESISQSRARAAVVFRYGRVKRLSADAVGERHIAIATRATTAVRHVEQCEFEERVGPAGPGDELSFHVYLCSEEDHGGKS